jgi:hypothetical protein
VGGQVSPAGQHSEQPTMLIVGGTPAVGYRSDSYRTYLNLWNGATWGTPEPDPSGNMTYSPSGSSPAFCADGSHIYLAVAIEGDSGSSGADFYDRIMAYEWSASTHWTAMNGGDEVSIPWVPGVGGSNAYEANIACRPSGHPMVSWIEQEVAGSDDADVYVAEVTGASSTHSPSLSRNNASGAYATNAEVAGITVNASGTTTTIAQWENHPSEMWRSDLYVTQYSGGAFANLGGSIATDYDPDNLSPPSLALKDGDLYVAYSAANSTDYTRHVYVKRYHGATWTTLGGGPVSAFGGAEHYDSSNPDLLLIEGVLFLAWDETDTYGPWAVHVAYWDEASGAWVMASDAITGPGAVDSIDPSLAYSASDDVIYIAFSALTDGWHHIFVKKIKRIGAEVTSIWPLELARCGEKVGLWARVENTGALPLPADAATWFYLDGSGWSGEHWVGSTNVSGLAPGAGRWVPFSWEASAGLEEGSYSYRAQVRTDEDEISAQSSPEAFTVLCGDSRMAFDFGAYGIYTYDGAAWSPLTAVDPEGMTSWIYQLAADFGAYGVYAFDGSVWNPVTAANPEGMMGWGPFLLMDLGAYGVYLYDGSSYISVTGLNPEDMTTWGYAIVLDLGAYGLYTDVEGSWTLVTPTSPEGMAAWGPFLVLDFGAYGLYAFDGTAWMAVTPSSPEDMIVWGTDLVVDFGSLGLYRYDGTSWTWITGSSPEAMAVWGRYLVLDFGPLGVYAYDGSGWTLITASDPQGMVSVVFD